MVDHGTNFLPVNFPYINFSILYMYPFILPDSLYIETLQEMQVME